jgi:hypothetical protein
MKTSTGYLNEAEIQQREMRLSAEKKAKALELIAAASDAISELNEYIEQLPEKLIIENSLALRYYLGRAGQNTRKTLGTGIPQGHKPTDAPAASEVDRADLRKLMRQRGFSEEEILRRFPVLPYERAAQQKAQELTEFEKFEQNFYKQQARRLNVPVETVAKNANFQRLARQTHDTMLELKDI